MDKPEPPIMAFETQTDWEAYLADHYGDEAGVWLRFYKKNSNHPTVSYAEALDVALCYGWIDAQVKRYDEESYLQKFTPRRKRSIWSKRNIQHIERLTKAGRMQPSGLQAVAAAQADGRWAQAYDSPSNMTMPEDFLQALAKNKKARALFETLSKGHVYAIAWRLQTAKRPETRERRLQDIIAMLARGEKFH